jgi:hypothetical protein
MSHDIGNACDGMSRDIGNELFDVATFDAQLQSGESLPDTAE